MGRRKFAEGDLVNYFGEYGYITDYKYAGNYGFVAVKVQSKNYNDRTKVMKWATRPHSPARYMYKADLETAEKSLNYREGPNTLQRIVKTRRFRDDVVRQFRYACRIDKGLLKDTIKLLATDKLDEFKFPTFEEISKYEISGYWQEPHLCPLKQV